MWSTGKKVAGAFESRSRAYLAPNESIAKQTWVKLWPYLTGYDGLNEWDTTDEKRWNCAADGVYRIVAVVGVRLLTLGDGPLVAIYKNGDKQYSEVSGCVVDNIEPTFALTTCSLELVAGDYIEVYAYHEYNGVRITQAGGYCEIARFA